MKQKLYILRYVLGRHYAMGLNLKLRLEDLRFELRCLRLLNDTRWFINHTAEDMVTEADDKANEAAQDLEAFLVEEWGVGQKKAKRVRA
jgi:hypothetical protein